MKYQYVLAATALAGLAGIAAADGRIWAQDASGIYNGWDNSGGAFVMHRIGTVGTAGYNLAQNNAGYVGQNLGQQGLPADGFHSFCIEIGESVSLANSNGSGNRYYAQIADSAVAGGQGSGDPSGTNARAQGAGEDVLSFVTAKIYSTFRASGSFGALGTLQSRTGDDGRRFVSAVQHAIWYSEGELSLANVGRVNSGTGTMDNTIRNYALGIYNWALQNHGSSLGNVRVLRLWSSFDANTRTYSGNRQDQLTLIPLPSSVALAGLGILGLGARARRRTF